MEPIQGSTGDAAGIPRSFPAGIKAAARKGLPALITDDPDRCGSPRLHTDHESFPAEPGKASFEIGQAVFQGQTYEIRQDGTQRCGHKSRPIGRCKGHGKIRCRMVHEAPR